MTISMLLVASAVAVAAVGQAEAGTRPGQTSREERRRHALERFDTNGDGQLDELERAAARKAHDARGAEWLKRFDHDGDGALSEAERAEAEAARKNRPERNPEPLAPEPASQP